MYKLLSLFFCLFRCPIVTHEPLLDQFVSNFDWGTRENHENVLGLALSVNMLKNEKIF